ncbi:MAG: spherulation-specific family 4 protein [Thaumarchaeota archaeon]|nr:spherulation-specific family 4 protein [Nitrososphaerota archaeon]
MVSPSRRFFYWAAVFILLLSFSFPAVSRPVSASATETGVIVPLYSYPGASWTAVIQAKDAHPSVPIVAVVNPDSGPGTTKDPNYAAWISDLRAAGITVIGYVYTEYSARSTSSIETDISTYKSWYGVSGIFFDQMSNSLGSESYYATLSSYAHSLGLTLTVGNAGTSVPAALIGSMNCVIIYENLGAPSVSTLFTSTMGLSKTNFAAVAYGVASPGSSYVSAISGYLNYLYLTDGAMPNPYSSTPSYFAALVADLDVPTPNVPVTIQSVTASGASLTGMWTVVQQGGRTVASGFTPFTFSATQGEEYTVSVANYGTYIFNRWSTGATTPAISFTASQATTLTAYYGAQLDLINVQSVTASGASLTGMWTVVQQGGRTVASGFTPFSFYGTYGTDYTVTVSSFGAYTFSHWENWSTDPSITVSLNQNTWLTAIY